VEDLDPIKQLQSLLDDRGKVLEKISGIQSALSSLKTSASLTHALPSAGTTETQPKRVSVSENGAYERLFQTLRDMQSQIEERVRPLAQETVQTELTRLREQSTQEQAALKDCLMQIDQSVSSCVERLQEYQRRHAELIMLNERLVALGAASEPLPEGRFPENITDMINLRLQSLQSAGKV
jgi:DNA repair exonuclease SbcCD ATPase subunit